MQNKFYEQKCNLIVSDFSVHVVLPLLHETVYWYYVSIAL